MPRTGFTGLLLVFLLMAPLSSSASLQVANEEPAWRSVGLDPDAWTDRPEPEESPMMESYTGNAVIEMNVSYQLGGLLSERVEGIVIIELFEQWAPITTNNMITHVESGLYDGVFCLLYTSDAADD